MKKIINSLFLLLCICSFAVLGTGCKESLREIAIIQYVTDIPLDKNRDGIIEGLKQNGLIDGENCNIKIYNCNADSSTVIQSVKTALSRSDLIVAIATPVAQVVVQQMEKQGIDIPVLFTAVTDPVSSNIVKDVKNPGGNVSGTSDLNAVALQIGLAKEINKDAKKVGFIYTAGEHNSIIQLNLAKEAAKNLGLEIVAQSATNETELKTVTQSLITTGVDAIYLPTDNKVAANANVVISEANLNKIPTIAGESGYLRKGATITKGSIDYYELGILTGKMGAKILNDNVKAGSLPVGYLESQNLEINITEATKAGIVIPDALKEKADNIL